jgi:hypothetical protein
VKHRILLVSPPESYRIQPYIRAAHSLNLEVLLASEGEWAISSPWSAGVSVPLSRHQDALPVLQTLARDTPVDAVIGTDDGTLELAAKLSEALGLDQNPPNSVRLARRKDLSRQCLREAGISTPAFTLINTEELSSFDQPEFGYPCVVKPLALSGSRGVIRADDTPGLNNAIQRSLKIVSQEADSYEKNHLLIEEFIPGREFAVEAMLTHGSLDVLAIFDKPDPLDGPFFEETLYVMPARISHADRDAMIATVQAACLAYGLVSGPVHAECRINSKGVWLIELAARTIGGMCSQLLTFGTGNTLEQLVLANALGLELTNAGKSGAAGVLMLPLQKAGVLRRVEGVLEAEKVVGIDEVQISIREGYRVFPLPEGASYLGFVFASGASPDAVEYSLREANRLIKPVVAPFWSVLNAKKEASA